MLHAVSSLVIATTLSDAVIGEDCHIAVLSK